VLASSSIILSGGDGRNGRGGPAYAASKAAIIGLTRSLARSFGELGIRVNSIAPGATATGMTTDYDEHALRESAQRTLLGRMARPEEMARVAAFLISNDASYITGENVNVNAGARFG
jgi:3-oxoacyl-[acyl-carrier protein] reductase